MAVSSLLALIDDIASTLDDVAILTKVATKKTAGVLGDDLALNAQQVTGVMADRELPVVWAVAKGSALNKVILIPSALLISFLLPAAIAWLLILGGSFLCYEGFEKIFEKFLHLIKKNEIKNNSAHESELIGEKEKIKGAVRTDFVLSAEIIVITLGSVAGATLTKQFLTLMSISALMTVGVYGLVAGIVKLDDLGLYLSAKNKSKLSQLSGQSILIFAPFLMKLLGVVGTIAMFLVGGGILTHNISWLHHFVESASQWMQIGFDLMVGVLLGGLIVCAVHVFQKIKQTSK